MGLSLFGSDKRSNTTDNSNKTNQQITGENNTSYSGVNGDIISTTTDFGSIKEALGLGSDIVDAAERLGLGAFELSDNTMDRYSQFSGDAIENILDFTGKSNADYLDHVNDITEKGFTVVGETTGMLGNAFGEAANQLSASVASESSKTTESMMKMVMVLGGLMVGGVVLMKLGGK